LILKNLLSKAGAGRQAVTVSETSHMETKFRRRLIAIDHQAGDSIPVSDQVDHTDKIESETCETARQAEEISVKGKSHHELFNMVDNTFIKCPKQGKSANSMEYTGSAAI
jgi:hypothetical protein